MSFSNGGVSFHRWLDPPRAKWEIQADRTHVFERSNNFGCYMASGTLKATLCMNSWKFFSSFCYSSKHVTHIVTGRNQFLSISQFCHELTGVFVRSFLRNLNVWPTIWPPKWERGKTQLFRKGMNGCPSLDNVFLWQFHTWIVQGNYLVRFRSSMMGRVLLLFFRGNPY